MVFDTVPVAYLIVIAVLCVLVGLSILVIMGNSVVLFLIAKLGFPIYSNKIKKDYGMLKKVNKDGKAWIDIPNIAYGPIMDGYLNKYKDKNYLGKFSVYGELMLSTDKRANFLQQFYSIDTDGIPDLSIIKGSPRGKGTELRHCNFMQLRKIRQKMAEGEPYFVSVCDEKGLHRYKPIAFIELDVSDTHVFQYSSREEFIKYFLSIANFRTDVNTFDTKIIILECNTGIDTVLVMLKEIK